MSTLEHGIDLVGLGKIAEAIPDEVYIDATKFTTEKIDQTLSPIFEVTSGLGRLIKQKFDNMVMIEKNLAIYSLQKAITKAINKSNTKGIKLIKPVHEKSFLRTLDETARETEPLLHAMWQNLISDQLTNPSFHPNFVNILSCISPEEAKILVTIKRREEIKESDGGYLIYTNDEFKRWVTDTGDTDFHEWNYACVLLYEYHFVDILVPKAGFYRNEESVVILYRTKIGDQFLEAVT